MRKLSLIIVIWSQTSFGCSDGKCQSNLDCSAGEICNVLGECTVPTEIEKNSVCEAGTTRHCYCNPGEGAQECSVDGQAWSVCVCDGSVVLDGGTTVGQDSGIVGTRLEWSDPEGPLMNYQDAENYCASLSYNGHTNWRLPNIDELKEFSGCCHCDPNNPGRGTCEISVAPPTCLNSTCHDHFWCNGCPTPGASNRGCFYPPEYTDPTVGCSELWSSNAIPDLPNRMWILKTFYGAYDTRDRSDLVRVRCTR